ncbi:hypothetical protein FAGAP_519 [Fusarium agapanthi]|uniref:Uncharacterized protein n=1 Tax=Fusarium agapanthi TaxID=1803897 RepID=A0A9P5BLC6_9HYPO|nr:hypothetical protein FAGAP_519 [Fusarium agapanthi]
MIGPAVISPYDFLTNSLQKTEHHNNVGYKRPNATARHGSIPERDSRHASSPSSAEYDSICENAHHWIIEHIDRIRESIVQELALHQPDSPDHYSDKQWKLTNKLHDLAENTAQADYTIMMPTDGYKGDSLSVKEDDCLTEAHGGGFRKEPISWSANLSWRASDYTKRVRYLDRKETYSHLEHEDLRRLRSSGRMSDPAWKNYEGSRGIQTLCRGLSMRDEDRTNIWVLWRTGCVMGIVLRDDDIEAAKKHFETMSDQSVHECVFLAIDEATMKSYLEPEPGKEKFALAVDANYKPTNEENVESPGYKETLPILGSLL